MDPVAESLEEPFVQIGRTTVAVKISKEELAEARANGDQFLVLKRHVASYACLDCGYVTPFYKDARAHQDADQHTRLQKARRWVQSDRPRAVELLAGVVGWMCAMVIMSAVHLALLRHQTLVALVGISLTISGISVSTKVSRWLRQPGARDGVTAVGAERVEASEQ